MAKDGKFGTFDGVYIPSLLTILGVIMYLRLPWILGNAGLYVTLGIIAAAHVVSVCTGLAVSSIATDKKVGAGGPYYIISRSLGLPIGGAVGTALFVGMSFAVALHIVGFSESVLSAAGVEATPTTIRLAGTATLLVITAVAFLSTSLAILMQYPILVIVALSIAAIFVGEIDADPVSRTGAHASSPSFGVLFGIFFPAATGFMSGVNMSGDLRDPQRSILRGTVLAIATAFLLYLAIVLFLHFGIDSERLRTDIFVLEHIAIWGPAVIVGIWGATLSSAFGAVLGAPRILQALSADRITPHVLAKGHGPSNEPRRATLVAFCIAEAGILIAELNVIARIVSMIYLTQYAFINLACVLESWASPDFRPKFRVPKLVPIIGFIACILLMIQLDLLAMLGAIAIMIGLFVTLQRRQLNLESGDAWEGVWATLVRTGLHRMHKKAGTQRNWRPNVLLFDQPGPSHQPVRAFAETLASGNGIVTDFTLAPPSDGDDADAAGPPDADKAGVFDTRIVTSEPLETVAVVCQHHGFSGLPPNTLLLPWRFHATDPDAYLRALNAAAQRGLNILLFEEPRGDVRPRDRRIDVWWARDAGNLALSVALARFITRDPKWERARLNVLLIGEGTDDDEVLRAKAVRYLASTRVDATVRVVQRPREERMHDLVCNESRVADLVLFGLPADLAAADRSSLERLEHIAALPGGVVFLRASTGFPDALVASQHARTRIPRVPGAPTPPAGVPAVALPQHPELASVMTAIMEHAPASFGRVHDRFAAAYGLYLDLCTTARTLVERRADAMTAAVGEADATKRRKKLAAATNDFLVEADRALAQITADGVAAQATLLGETLAELVKPSGALPSGVPAVLEIELARSRFASGADDSPTLRAWKRGKRWRYFYRRQIPLAIPLAPLLEQDHERVIADEVDRIAERFRIASHDLAVEISRTLATAEWKAHAELSRSTVEAPDALVERIASSRTDALRRLDGLAARARERIAEDAQALDAAVLANARRLAGVLDRVDAPVAAKAARKPVARTGHARLLALPERWRDEQLALLARARLSVRLARYRDRLTIATARALEEVLAMANQSGQRALVDLRASLAGVAAGSSGRTPPELHDEVPYDAAPIVARLAQVASALSGELPETEVLLTDDAASALVRGDAGGETTTVPVRAAVQAVVEMDLMTRFGAEVAQVADADGRAWVVGREISLLVSARPRESEDDDQTGDGANPVGDAIARLDAQLAKLREIERACVQGVLDGLQAVASATAPDAVGSSLAERGGRRVAPAKRARVRALVRRGGELLRDAAANVIYRRSAGVVYAENVRVERARSAEQHIRDLVGKCTVSPSVAASVPVYYRNLFTGQVNINESFFVGREDQVKAGVATVTGERAIGLRTALVLGGRGAGKTTLCQQIASAAKSDVYWIAAPPGGAATRQAFEAAVQSAIGGSGPPAQVVGRLGAGALLVIDDLDLWWERRPDGLAAIEAMLDLIAETGDRHGYVLAAGEPTARVLERLRPLSRIVQGSLVCQPLPARALEKVIMARHASTGLRLKLAGRESLGTWARARLFDAHFDNAKGNAGYALRSWVTHVDSFADDVITVRTPAPLDWSVLDDLRSEHVALLVELVLHKAANVEKLERLTGRPAGAISDGLADLGALGLVVQNRRKIAQINPSVHVPVSDWLDRRDLA